MVYPAVYNANSACKYTIAAIASPLAAQVPYCEACPKGMVSMPPDDQPSGLNVCRFCPEDQVPAIDGSMCMSCPQSEIIDRATNSCVPIVPLPPPPPMCACPCGTPGSIAANETNATSVAAGGNGTADGSDSQPRDITTDDLLTLLESAENAELLSRFDEESSSVRHHFTMGQGIGNTTNTETNRTADLDVSNSTSNVTTEMCLCPCNETNSTDAQNGTVPHVNTSSSNSSSEETGSFNEAPMGLEELGEVNDEPQPARRQRTSPEQADWAFQQQRSLVETDQLLNLLDDDASMGDAPMDGGWDLM